MKVVKEYIAEQKAKAGSLSWREKFGNVLLWAVCGVLGVPLALFVTGFLFGAMVYFVRLGWRVFF